MIDELRPHFSRWLVRKKGADEGQSLRDKSGRGWQYLSLTIKNATFNCMHWVRTVYSAEIMCVSQQVGFRC